jgi:hypothetical protein
MARMVARIDELDGGTKRGRRARRRVAAVGGGVVCAGLLVMGVAGAAPTTSTTDVTFVPLTAAHKVLSATISANKTTSAVIIGGSTTVPSDATTVKLVVTAKGAAAGDLNFYPAGNLGGGSGQFLPYPSGNTLVSATIEENVGQSGELTFYNVGKGSVVVTASVVAYSTQVTAGDINGTGGTAGQVLTNTGAGATWTTQGQSFATHTGFVPVGFTFTPVDSLAVPAGSYLVSDAYNVYAGVPEVVSCYLVSPAGNGSYASNADASISAFGTYYGSGYVQFLLTTGGGAVTFGCYAQHSGTQVGFDTLVATQVNSASGGIPAIRHAAATQPGLGGVPH